MQACAGCEHYNSEDEFYDGDQGTTDCGQALEVDAASAGVDFFLREGRLRTPWDPDFQLNTASNIGFGFEIHPGFNDYLVKASVTGPGGYSFEFDLENDTFDWLNECSYIDMWWKSLDGGTTFPGYGEYTMTLLFSDGYEETYTRNVTDTSAPAVNVATMSHTVGASGDVEFNWTPPDTTKDYQVRVHDDSDRFYRSGIMQTETSVTASVDLMRCMEQGKTYKWYVRTYAGAKITNSAWKEDLVYNPASLDDRVEYFHAAVWNGKLLLVFDTRPGSRDHLTSAEVSGPGGFTATYDLTNDWMDRSSETSFARDWVILQDLPATFLGTYTGEFTFADGHTETIDSDITAGTVTGVDSATMWINQLDNGDIDFHWTMPGVAGQKYSVIVRSMDGDEEFIQKEYQEDVNSNFANFYDLRGLRHGKAHQWFVRTQNADGAMGNDSDPQYFIYNPFNLSQPGDTLAFDFGADGLWAFDSNDWGKISDSDLDYGCGWADGFAMDFAALGLWNARLDGTWYKVSDENPEHMVSWANGLAMDFGALGIWNMDINGTWSQISTSNPDNMVFWTNGLAMDFGAAGLWNIDVDGNWTMISTSNPDNMARWANGLAMDFGALGIWNIDSKGAWSRISDVDPEGMAGHNFGLAMDFGTLGIWSVDAKGDWMQISSDNPNTIVGWGNGLAMDFGAAGIWNIDYDQNWTKVSDSDPEGMFDVDFY